MLSRRQILPLIAAGALALLAALPAAAQGAQPLSIGGYNWTVTPESSSAAPVLRRFVLSRIDPVPGATWYLLERVTDATGQTVDDVGSDPFPLWFQETERVFEYYASSSSEPDVRYVRISAWSERPGELPDEDLRLTAINQDAVATIDYDARFKRMNFLVDVACGAEIGVGVPEWECEMTATPEADDPTSDQIELYSWHFLTLDRYDSAGTSDCSDDTFTFKRVGATHTPVPRLRFSIAQDGVTFVGLYGAWNGTYGYTSRPTEVSGHRTASAPKSDPQTWTPMAIVTDPAGLSEDDAQAVTCMEGFTGVVPGQDFVKTLEPIPGGVRFAPLKHEVTIFNGGSLFVPMGSANPDFVEVDLPETIHLIDNTFRVAPNNQQQYTVQVVNPPPSDVPTGYHRYRLEKLHGDWSYKNNNLPLYFAFEPGKSQQIVAGGPYDMKLRPTLNSTPCPVDEPDQCWQTVKVRPVEIPVVPLPQRLKTDVTWSDARLFVTLPTSDPLYDPTVGFFEIYRRLGFNSVPLVSAQFYDPDIFAAPNDEWIPILYTPADRIGDSWAGLDYGIQHSPLQRGFYDNSWWVEGLSELLTWTDTAPNEEGEGAGKCFGYGEEADEPFDRFRACVDDKIENHLDPADRTDAEIDAWARALVFHAETGEVDMAYDGALLDRDLGLLAETLAYTQPEYLHLDAEFFPWFETEWVPNVRKSVNACLRRDPDDPDETDQELARRMVEEFWDKVMASIESASPDSKVSLYDAGAALNWGYQAFPWDVLESHDVIPTPSLYLLSITPHLMGPELQRHRDAMPATFNTRSGRYEMQPWITSGTYGERPAEDGFVTVAHMFLNGATGFNFYSPRQDIDDMDDWLKISEGVRMFSWPADDHITGLDDAGYPSGINGEDVVFDGVAAHSGVSNIAVDEETGRATAVVSAMKLAGVNLIAVTPHPLFTSPEVSFDVALTASGGSGQFALTDLRDADLEWSVSVVGSTATFHHPGLARSTVLRYHLLNEPPAAQNVAIVPPGPTDADDLLASYAYLDADRNPEDVSQRLVRWFRDGARQASLDDLLQVPSTATAEGESWHFELQVSDGRAIGATQVSSAVVIGCAPPVDQTYLYTLTLDAAGDVVLHFQDQASLGSYDVVRGTLPTGLTSLAQEVSDVDPVEPNVQWIDRGSAGVATSYYVVRPHSDCTP